MPVSCVIPTRDRAEMVSGAVASVLAQQDCGTGLEIVVVDDGSVDGTSSLLASRFPDLKLVRMPGLGPGAARNAGVAAAAGEIIMFLDSDDRWTSDHARRLLLAMKRGRQVAYGVARNRDQITGGEFFIPDQKRVCHGDCFADLLRWCFLVPSAMAVTRAAFSRVGGFSRAGLGEDWGFFLQLAQFYDFSFAGPGVITERRLHPGSLCCLQDRRDLASALTALRDLPWQPEFAPAAVGRFEALLAWLADHPAPLASVQEWYLALHQDHML